jgi:protein involved in polysaccharide export with SLBB domain
VLPIFGADLFTTPPSTFAPVDNIPVTPDYVIGPGDELHLQIWGQINQRGSFVVDRTGSISLPTVGTIHVAGLAFSQLSDFLKSQLTRVYRNFDLNVNLGQLRSIQVFVVGRAKKPGNYTIGSLSTLLNALFASGGPLPEGSLRDIQVRRGTQTITHFDLYELLLHGDKTKDVGLQSGDVIFIPDVGPQVAVLGSVSAPGIYELHGETNFNQVVTLAGGLTNVAAGTELRVERVYQHAQHSELSIDLSSSDAPSVQDGDIISAASIIGKFQNAVTLRGNVANPGRYPWHAGMHVSDLVPNREALVTRNYYQRQNELGLTNSDYEAPQPGSGAQGAKGSTTSRSPTQGALGLQSGIVADAAVDRGIVGANGGGNSVGATLTEGNTNFAATTDVILSAPDIDWDYAVIERQNEATLKTTLVPFNLGKVVLDKDKSQDLELLNGDIVTIFSKADIRVPSEQQTKFVKLEGEFVSAGVYSVQPGETLRQLVARAGGLTPDAYLYASEFTRETVRRVERQRIIEYADALEGEISARSASLAASALTDRDAASAQASAVEARATLARLRQAQPSGRIVFQLTPESQGVASLPDVTLEDGDRFVVPKMPSTVSVQGQVYDANAFIYKTGRRVKDYLQLAGGPNRDADQRREFILRADGSVVSRQYGNLAERALFTDHDFDHIATLPGDTIVVPPTVEKGSFMRNLVNISNILEGFGIGAAAIQVLK